MTAQDGGLFTSCPGGQEAALDTRGLVLAPSTCTVALEQMQKLGEVVEEANP